MCWTPGRMFSIWTPNGRINWRGSRRPRRARRPSGSARRSPRAPRGRPPHLVARRARCGRPGAARCSMLRVKEQQHPPAWTTNVATVHSRTTPSGPGRQSRRRRGSWLTPGRGVGPSPRPLPSAEERESRIRCRSAGLVPRSSPRGGTSPRATSHSHPAVQRPFQFGFRFSRNARTPSRKSSEPYIRSIRSSSPAGAPRYSWMRRIDSLVTQIVSGA